MKPLVFGLRLASGKRLHIQVTATEEPHATFDPEMPVEVSPSDIAEALETIARATTLFRSFDGLQIAPKP